MGTIESIDNLIKKISTTNENIQQGIAIMLAKQYLSDQDKMQTKEDFIKGISTQFKLPKAILEWGFEYVESGGSILLINKEENEAKKNTRREGIHQKDISKDSGVKS